MDTEQLESRWNILEVELMTYDEAATITSDYERIFSRGPAGAQQGPFLIF